MYLFYVTATEMKKNQEVEGDHAVLANDEAHLVERCTELFVKFNPPSSKHQLSSDWNCK